MLKEAASTHELSVLSSLPLYVPGTPALPNNGNFHVHREWDLSRVGAMSRDEK